MSKMKITEETKIKDLIPEKYELDKESPYSLEGSEGLHLIMRFKKKKFKTIEDYEKELNNSSDRIISKSFFSILKDDYPKQYYSIILQMIADDICEEGIERHYYINIEKDSCWPDVQYQPIGIVLFDTKGHSNQAIEIMGDKLKYLL